KDLYPSRTGADDRDSLAAGVDVGPARGVHHRPSERVESGDVRDEWVMQDPGGGDDEVRVDLVAVGGAHPPTVVGEHRLGDFAVESQVRCQLQLVDQVAVIALDFVAGSPDV